MTDAILVGTVIAFFAAAALLVRALGPLIADSVDDADSEGPEDAASASGHEAKKPA
jgi:hypothetical protein